MIRFRRAAGVSRPVLFSACLKPSRRKNRRAYTRRSPRTRSLLIQMRDDSRDQPFQVLRSPLGDGEDFFNCCRLEGIGKAQVGDDRKRQRPQAGMRRYDHFGNRRHSDDIGSQITKHAILGPRFQIGPRHSHENAGVGRDPQLEGRLARGGDQLGDRRGRSCRETADRADRR